MCGGLLAPILAVASIFSGMASGGGKQESYTPPEQNFDYTSTPAPTEAPTIGLDDADDSVKAKQKGRAALRIDRDIATAVPGGGSGIAVPQG